MKRKLTITFRDGTKLTFENPIPVVEYLGAFVVLSSDEKRAAFPFDLMESVKEEEGE